MMTRAIPLALLLSLTACGDDKKSGPDTAAPDTVEADASDTDTAETPDAEPTDTADSDVQPDTSPDVPVGPISENNVLVFSDEVMMAMGASRPVNVEIPANVISVTISVVGDEGAYYGLGSWTGPNGFELVHASWTSSQEAQSGLCLSCKNRIALSGGAFAAIAPNNPASQVEAGEHSFTLFGYNAPPVVQGQGQCGDGICHFADQFQCERDCRTTSAAGPVRVEVYAKVAEALPTEGVLDMNLHFTGAQGLTAESAKTDEKFQGYLDSMEAIYQTVGIRLGELTYRDIDAGYKVIESLDGEGSDLQAMFALSEGNPNAVNLFFVDELSAGAFGGFGVILGIAGGIPGPPLVQGSPRSGVAIALKPVQGVPAEVDTTMAHEVGHFLGLYHTSEQAFFPPQIHDPLPDTPENDDSYLMFNTGSGHKLSPWQGRVMIQNPFVRHPE